MPLLPSETHTPVPVAPTVQAVPVEVDLTRLPGVIPDFRGRAAGLAALDSAWTATGKTRALVLAAPGGNGKTSVVRRWLSAMDQAGQARGPASARHAHFHARHLRTHACHRHFHARHAQTSVRQGFTSAAQK